MIAIINNGGANLTSIIFALERLGFQAKLTQDAHEIQRASHVILPGVGAAAFSMRRLQELHLVEVIRSLKQPTLGICLGMQLLYQFSEEGNVECLGITEGKITHLKPQPVLTIPHMGWNSLQIMQSSLLLRGVEEHNFVYFVHSYAAPETSITCAAATYNQRFAAVIEQNNFFGTQFHPEKSGKTGEIILRNFLEL